MGRRLIVSILVKWNAIIQPINNRVSLRAILDGLSGQSWVDGYHCDRSLMSKIGAADRKSSRSHPSERSLHCSRCPLIMIPIANPNCFVNVNVIHSCIWILYLLQPNGLVDNIVLDDTKGVIVVEAVEDTVGCIGCPCCLACQEKCRRFDWHQRRQCCIRL